LLEQRRQPASAFQSWFPQGRFASGDLFLNRPQNETAPSAAGGRQLFQNPDRNLYADNPHIRHTKT
jgi:hypothetical protein